MAYSEGSILTVSFTRDRNLQNEDTQGSSMNDQTREVAMRLQEGILEARLFEWGPFGLAYIERRDSFMWQIAIALPFKRAICFQWMGDKE